MLTAYLDESWDASTMCVGGWLCNVSSWRLIQGKWERHIQRENKTSLKLNLQLISRYKAADLGCRKGEFDGWTKQREVAFTKNLIDVLRMRNPRSRPIGIACGISFGDMLAASREWDRDHSRHKWERAAYRLCMLSCLRMVLETMTVLYPEEKVAVVHDHGKFNGPALSAFNAVKANPTIRNREALLTVTAKGWEDCVALQPADMMAFEARKLISSGIADAARFRRSLQRIIGQSIHIRVHTLPKAGLVEIMEKHLRALEGEDYQYGAGMA